MLRAVIGFDHIAKNVQNSWLANCGYNLILSTGANAKPLIINSDGALTTTSGVSSGLQTQSVLDLSPFMVTSGFTVVTLGVRVKVLEGVPTGPFAYLGSVVNGSDASWVYTWALAGSPPNATGSEFFVEYEMVLSSNIVNIYVDGVLAVANVPLTAAVSAAIKTGKLVIFHAHSGQNLSHVYSVRDIYLLDNIVGDGFTKRLGSRRVSPIIPDAAVGAGWTTTDSSPLLTPLLVSPEVANPATLTAPSNKTPLKVSLKGNVPANGSVEAVMLYVSGKVDLLGSVTKARVEDGAAASVDKALAADFPTTLKYGLPVGIYPKHPSGVAWTNANLDTTNLVLSPDTVG